MQNDFNQSLVFAAAATKYTDVYQLTEKASYVDLSANVSSISGVGASLAITVQVSDDAVNWEDRITFGALAATGLNKLKLEEPRTYLRFKTVLTGTTPTAVVVFYAMGRSGGSGDSESTPQVPYGTPTYIGKNSGGDFTLTYASATTITVGTLPNSATLGATDIVSLYQFSAQGSVVAIFSRDDSQMSISGGVLTVTGANFKSDDKFVLYTNVAKATNSNLQIGGADVSSTNPVFVQEIKAAQSEDDTNMVTAVAPRPLASNTYAWSRFANFGANATLNVKNAAGNVMSIYCYNKNAAGRHIQIHNTASTPAGGAVPSASVFVPAAGSVYVGKNELGEIGTYLSTGIAFAFSTDPNSYVAGAAADQTTIIHYK